MPYICVEKCWHKGTLYKVGREAKFAKAEDGPRSKDGKKLLYFKEVARVPAPGETRVEQLETEVARLTKMVETLTASDDNGSEMLVCQESDCGFETKGESALKRHMTMVHPEID